MRFAKLLLHPPALSDIFNGKKHHLRPAGALNDTPGFKPHYFASDGGKLVFNLKVLERGVLGEKVLQQFLEVWYIPLAVAHFVDQVVFRLPGRGLELLVKRSVRGFYLQILVEDDERSTNRFHDRFSIITRLSYLLQAPFERMDIDPGQNGPVDFVFHGSVGPNLQGIPEALAVLNLLFLDRSCVDGLQNQGLQVRDVAIEPKVKDGAPDI